MIRRHAVAMLSLVLGLGVPLTLPGTASAADVSAPWHAVDVGDVGLPGSAGITPTGELSVNGAGSDVWGTADSFFFVYQSDFHEGFVAAAPTLPEPTHAFAKAGLMIRSTLDPGSPHVILDVRPDGSVEFMTRQVQGGETMFVAGLPGSNHRWDFELIRTPGAVTALVYSSGSFVVAWSTPFPSGAALVGAAVTSHDPSKLCHVMAGPPFVSHVQLPWNETDWGLFQNVGIPGSTSVENGVFTVRGSGADIWGTVDQYHAVWTPIYGEGHVVARVLSEDAAHTFAKAGVIMNDTANVVILDIRPNGVIEFMARNGDGQNMQFIAGSAASFPVWLKIERRGSRFTGLMSNDGHSWQVVGQTTNVGVFNSMAAGLAVTAHDRTALNTSRFDHVEISSGPGQYWPEFDVGDTGGAGGPAQSDAIPLAFVRAGGSDIWGTADGFRYAYQSLKDDGQITVRLSGLTDTNEFAKSGLMIRDSLDPSAAHVILDVRPNGGIEFMTRSSPGAETSFLAGGATSFPVWLKLARSGFEITGSTSPDGVTWTPIGSVSAPAIPPDALVGVAVTSHQPGVITTATFGNLSR